MQIGQTPSSNISALTRNNALINFEQNKKLVKEQIDEQVLRQKEAEQEKELAQSLQPDNEFKKKYDETISEIKNFATQMGEELSDEDINYALRYGRSVLVDYSA